VRTFGVLVSHREADCHVTIHGTSNYSIRKQPAQEDYTRRLTLLHLDHFACRFVRAAWNLTLSMSNMALEYQNLGNPSIIGVTFLFTLLALSIGSYVWSYFTRPRQANIPTYRVSFGSDAAKVLLEAHEEVYLSVPS
jgi:hypothetical protein